MDPFVATGPRLALRGPFHPVDQRAPILERVEERAKNSTAPPGLTMRALHGGDLRVVAVGLRGHITGKVARHVMVG